MAEDTRLSLRERQLSAVQFILLNQLLGNQLNGGEPRVPTYEGLCSTAEDIVDGLAALSTATGEATGGWRPIAEVAAKEGDRAQVWVIYDPPHRYYGAGRVESGYFDGDSWDGEGVGGVVTHVRPLPPPPETTGTGGEK